MSSGRGRVGLQGLAALLLPALVALPACGPSGEAGDAGSAAVEVTGAEELAAAPAVAGPVHTEGRLALVVTGARSGEQGNRCVLAVQARNDTGAPAVNVQAAWMARTDGFGFISDYQVLGDFAVGEERAVQFGIFGAPCDAVQGLELSRAVCTVGPVQSPPHSCAELVVLDASAIAKPLPASR
jgi:hypothetical protein